MKHSKIPLLKYRAVIQRMSNRGLATLVRIFGLGLGCSVKPLSLLGIGQRSNAYAKPSSIEPLLFRILGERIWNLGVNRARNGMCTLIQKQTQRLTRFLKGML